MTARCSRCSRRTAAFTLTEVVIAMAILAVGVMSVINLRRWVVRGTEFNIQHTTATFFAQDKIEELVAAPYDTVASGSDATQGMSRAWTVATVGNYKTVNITVSWNSFDGGARSTQLKTILVRR